MIKGNIEVPGYLAEQFNTPLGHPSGKIELLERSIERVFRLINEALKGICRPDWEVDGGRYCSQYDNEPYGFERCGNSFIIYVRERDQKKAVAIFHGPSLAAEYFVWLVSAGERKIDWSQLLEMES